MRVLVVESDPLHGGARLDVPYHLQAQQNQQLRSTRYSWKRIEELTIDLCDGPRNVALASQGIPYLRTGDLNAEEVSQAEGAFVEDRDIPERFRLKPGDLLLSKTSDELRTAMVGEDLSGAIFSPDLYRLRIDTRMASPAWVSLFFRGRYAANIFSQISCGTRIRRLCLADLRKLQVPLPPRALAEEVEALEREAQEESASARSIFSALLKGLYAEINERVGRPKTDEKWLLASNEWIRDRWDIRHVRQQGLIQDLLETPIFRPVGEIARIAVSSRKDLDLEQEVRFVQVSDIDSRYFTFGRVRKGKVKDLPDRIRLPLREFQVLVLASGSNLGTATHPIAVVEPDLDGCLASNAFLALEFQETPIYFGLVMRHPLVLAQLRGLASGSVISLINKREIRNLRIPVLGPIWRQDYNDRARIAWEKRRRAIHLRQEAVDKIEDFIDSMDPFGQH